MCSEPSRDCSPEPAVRLMADVPRMSPAQRRAFENDGFFVIPSFLTAPELTKLLAAAEALARQYRSEAPLPSQISERYSRNGYTHRGSSSRATGAALETDPPFQVCTDLHQCGSL
eukprot:SAG31_NODE_21013_length_559_cov_2.936957_1_plen_115_part_00